MNRIASLLLAFSTAASLAYGAPAKEQRATVRITVRGMFCSSCSDTVQQAVAPLPGTISVAVDRRKNLVTVTYDRSKGSVQQMLEAIRKVGYRAEPALPSSR